MSKAYRLYGEPRDRLRQAVRPRLARLARRLGVALPERRYYAEHWALRDVSFEVARGETVAIIGRNGAGKSTLLQLICGTLTPSAGEVAVAGRVAALLELGSGFNPEYTGRENVLLNAAVLGLSREQAEARLGAILGFAEIGGFVDQPVKTYSSGMTMRLAFAVAAHVDADVLLVDEALSVGDAYFQQKCFRWLRDFQRRGTLLFCGHDLGAVVGLCERAIWIEQGQVRLSGPAKQVADAYASFTHAQSMGLPEPAVPVLAAPPGARPAAPAAAEDGPAFLFQGVDAGSGLASIAEVALRDAEGRTAGIVLGGQEVVLAVRGEAHAPLAGLVIGVQLKDRLGQVVFTRTCGQPLDLAAGEGFAARIRLRMPRLVDADYAFGLAALSAGPEGWVPHAVLHEALVVRVHTPGHLGGLLAVPLDEARLELEAG